MPLTLQVTEAAQHAPAIIEAARPLADTDRGLVLAVVGLLALVVVGLIALGVMALRTVRRAAPSPESVTGGLDALRALPAAVEGMSARLEGKIDTMGGKIDTLTGRVDAQAETIARELPRRTAEAIAERTRVRWNGDTPRVDHTPAHGLRALGSEPGE